MGDTTSEDAVSDDATNARAVAAPGKSLRGAILAGARTRARPFDRPGQATVLTWAAIVFGAASIRNAYEYDHFTHQWQNTAVIWVAALCALAAAHRAIAVAVLRPRTTTVTIAAFVTMVLAGTGCAAMWQTDQSMTVPVYTEAAPATYGDSVYVYISGHGGGGVVRQETVAVVELVPGRELAERSPNARCWAVLTTFATTHDAGRWPWQPQQSYAPGVLEIVPTMEVADLSGDWHEVNGYAMGMNHYCGTDWFPGEDLYAEPPFGVAVLGRLTVSTIDGPPTALRITDDKGRVNVIDLQDPGTECAKEEEGPDWDLSSSTTNPCDRIYDLEDQALNDRVFGPDEPWVTEEE